MLQERDTCLCNKYRNRTSSHFFNSLFVQRLLITDNKYNFLNVQRWTKDFDIYEKDKIIFPINITNSHWTLAVVYMRREVSKCNFVKHL